MLGSKRDEPNFHGDCHPTLQEAKEYPEQICRCFGSCSSCFEQLVSMVVAECRAKQIPPEDVTKDGFREFLDLCHPSDKFMLLNYEGKPYFVSKEDAICKIKKEAEQILKAD